MPEEGIRRVVSVLLGLGLAGCFLYLARPLLMGGFYAEDDLGAFHIPLRYFYAQALAEGHSFLWMPHIFNGFYLLSEGQIGLLHPWHWLLYRFIPLSTAFTLELWISYPLMAWGWYVFLRRQGLDAQGALLGGVLGSVIGFPLNHYIHLHFVATLAHLPWALLLIDSILRNPGGSPWRWVGILGLSVSQLLLAMPQAIVFSWLVEGLYTLFLFWGHRQFISMLHLGMAKVLAIFMAAMQLLPLWEGLQNSYRAAPTDGFTLSISLNPLNLLQLLNPYLFHRRVFAPFKGDEPWDAPYLGAATLVLVMVVLLCWRSLEARSRQLSIFGLLLGILGTLLAIGHYGFLDGILAHTPILNKLRAPARFIALTHVGLLLVAAVGFHGILRGTFKGIQRAWWGPVLIMICSLGTLGYVVLHGQGIGLPFGEAVSGQVLPLTHVGLGAGLVVGASLLTLLALRGHGWALPVLVVLIVVDISAYSMRHKPISTMDAYLAETPKPPDAEEGARLDTDIHPMYMNRYTFYDHRVVYGYTALLPERVLDYTQEVPLRIAGVSWHEGRDLAIPRVAEAYQGGAEWIAMQDPLPRIRVVNEARVVGDPSAELNIIDPEKVVLTDTLTLPPDGTMANVSSVEEVPGRFEIEVSSGGGILVVAESWHSGWQAEIDGSVTPIERAYGDFMALPLPEEASTVVLRFSPKSYSLGRWISLGGLVLAILYGLVVRRWP